MKKIVFCSICLQPEEKFTAVYSAKQEDLYSDSKYEKKIYYPVNAVLANDLTKDDELKVVILKTVDNQSETAEKNFKANYKRFIDEVTEICAEKGVKSNIDNPVIVESEFKETSDVFEKRFMDIFEVLEEDAEIYADTTFGSRVFSMILMNVVSFAEKFFNNDVKAIVYGKTSFENGKATEGTVYDISALYLMNNLTNALKADSGKAAIEAFRKFLNN